MDRAALVLRGDLFRLNDKGCAVQGRIDMRLGQWNRIFFVFASLVLLGLGALISAGLGDRLTHEGEVVEQELQEVEQRLDGLVPLNLSNVGSQFGYRTRRCEYQTPRGSVYFTIDLGKVYPLDQIFLLPIVPIVQSMSLDQGVDVYAFPRRFRISVSEAEDFSDPLIVWDQEDLDFEKTTPYPLRIECSGVSARLVRVELTKLAIGPASPKRYQAELAEIFVFSGEENVALGKPVDAKGQNRVRGLYEGHFLVDGKTPLGFPVSKNERVAKRGWHSRVFASERNEAFVELRFPKPILADTVLLYPARASQLLQLEGYGFPQNLDIWIQREDGVWECLFDYMETPYLPPGANPAAFVFDQKKMIAVRVRVLQLPYILTSGYALAFSEIEVLHHGKNLAPRASVHDKNTHHDPKNWSRAALTDGKTSFGTLLGWRRWLNELADRHALQDRLGSLRQRQMAHAQQARRRLRVQTAGGIFLLLTGGAGVVGYVFFQRGQRKKEIARVRERIAGDLHDEVGSNLGGIQLHADLLKLNVPDSPELLVIQNLAAETVSAVRDIVWLLRPSISERIALADHLRETGAILMDGMSWAFDADQACQALELSDVLVHDLMLFYREALHNLRHAQATKVTVQMRKKKKQLQLTIHDDGCGISAEKLARPSTLRALRKRAEKMNGTMELQTTVGSGTTITLTVELDSV